MARVCTRLLELRRFVREIGGRVYIFHTVGWSGNESVIAAMKQNPLFWSLAFELHAKGGLYVLTLPDRA
ncbi:MAG: hypothetical protein WHV66_00090 [Anaerolineales bacterium]